VLLLLPSLLLRLLSSLDFPHLLPGLLPQLLLVHGVRPFPVDSSSDSTLGRILGVTPIEYLIRLPTSVFFLCIMLMTCHAQRLGIRICWCVLAVALLLGRATPPLLLFLLLASPPLLFILINVYLMPLPVILLSR